MRRLLSVWLIVVCFSQAANAQKFFLVDANSDKRYGPFELKQGGVVKLGNQSFIIQKPDNTAVEDAMNLEVKLQKIRVPLAEMRNATLKDALDFIRKAAVEFDDPAIPENERGVNIILNLQNTKESELTTVTINARNMTLADLLKSVLAASTLGYRIEGSVIYIEPKKK